MRIEKNAKDLMTPIERKKAIQNGERGRPSDDDAIYQRV